MVSPNKKHERVEVIAQYPQKATRFCRHSKQTVPHDMC